MNRRHVIYAIRLDGRPIYVGLSVSFLSRWRQHLCLAKGPHRHRQLIHTYMANKGIERFDAIMLEAGLTRAEANEAEKKWISALGTLFPVGANLELGGDSHSHHPETREKISRALKGCVRTPPSQSTLQRRSLSLRERWKKIEGTNRQRRGVGWAHSEETLARMRVAQANRNPSTVARGETHGCSKLTLLQVEEIRAAQGMRTQENLARCYGVARSTISMIHTGATWGATVNE